MSVHEILILVMAVFALLGAADRIFGDWFGLGKAFENGILAMGALAMAMLGIIVLAPVLADVLRPLILPCLPARFWLATWAVHPWRRN